MTDADPTTATAPLGREGTLGDFWTAIRPVAAALAVGLALFGVLFWSEASAAVGIWESSTAYNHCFFVIPIALYLAWDRRDDVVGRVAQPVPWIGVLILPLALLWFATERLGIMEGRQLIVITMVEILFLACLGWQLAWALSAALLYLIFLVPFGYFLTPWLQHVTAVFTDIGLTILGIPHYSDDLIIEIPDGRFLIAEACAGLRFLVASVAFGVLYACLIYRSPGRRVLFFAASLVIPVVANGFRALGIVTLGHILGSAEAAAADHLVYGWIFNSFVILLLIAAGMPFREDHRRTPVARPAVTQAADAPLARRLQPVMAVVLIGLFAAAGPLAAAWFDRAGLASKLATVAPHFVLPNGCAPASGTPDKILATGWGVLNTQDFTCGSMRLHVLVQVFPARVSPAALAASRARLSGEDLSDERIFSSLTVPGIEPQHWRTVTTEDPPRLTAMTYWLDGKPSGGGLADRLRQARNSLFGAPLAPGMMAVSAEPIHPQGKAGKGMTGAEHQMAERVVAVFLNAQATLADQVASMASQPTG